MNLKVPRVNGDPDDLKTLKAWLRRFIVLVLQSSYTSDPNEVDFEKCIVGEDPELRQHLTSGEARATYVLDMSQNTIHCQLK